MEGLPSVRNSSRLCRFSSEQTKPPVSSFRAATKPKCIVCQVVLRVRKKSNRIGGPREDPRGIDLDLY